MNLGIAGKNAIVCGGSKGLGAACATALAAEGVNVTLVARHADELERTATQIQQAHPESAIRVLVADLSTAEGQETLFLQHPTTEILVTNAGGPAPGDFRNWSEAEWLAALRLNMLMPIQLIQHYVDDMAEAGFGRIVNITSSAVKAPIEELGLSNGARSGLTGFVAGLARSPQLASRNVTVNNLLPGAFRTDRMAEMFSAAVARLGGTTAEHMDRRVSIIPARRFGEPLEFGHCCAFLCSAYTGYITGQNILIDGGSYRGTF
ncbi:SDR family NAD(P)-dependent oxidoreductase [Hydrogenophaga sp. BPS33]|uniref:SDR family NAD(P)-dependent oxidoreductase n=1 Tax=Hydrogenophaga sp. BPS33 TaxID=2651974 RepID=UPI00131F6197|nr:SDR family NAD(P)-dependent oxidoreductase [Hydrogenophaga sp. BPS33]QHE84677.1 SDR family oxidoreductase [Hydrogenophaga sp. BPS33]